MSSIKTIGNNINQSVVLISNEGDKFEVDISVVSHSNTIKDMIEVFTQDEPIPLTTINSAITEKVMIFCDYIQNNPEDLEKLKTWLEDNTFTYPLPQWFDEFISVEQTILLEIIKAANFLDIQILLNFGCKSVARIIRFKTPEELQNIFGQNDEGASAATP